MASRGRRSLPSRLLSDSRLPLRPRPKPPDLNFHRHNVHNVLLLHSPLVLTTIPLSINAIPCDSSTDQKKQGNHHLFCSLIPATRTKLKATSFDFIPLVFFAPSVNHTNMSSRMEPVIITSQPLTSSSKLVPRALFHQSRRQGHTRLYRLSSSAKQAESKLPAFPDSPRSFIPQPRLVSHDGQAQSYNPIPIIPAPGDQTPLINTNVP
ncbi:hypothetical protein Tco_0209374 [Tanacetum coccineum]